MEANMKSKILFSVMKAMLLVIAITPALLGTRPAATQGNSPPIGQPALAPGKMLRASRPAILPSSEAVLYNFQANGQDGYTPSSLIADSDGNFYGTTLSGGTAGLGTVFELSPQSGGGWAEAVLYSFQVSPDGNTPFGNLIFDKSGNLYGTTTLGGPCHFVNLGCGTVFELSPQSGGGWSESILFNFTARDGNYPVAGLVFDNAGNLFGTTEFGGIGNGIVFELSPQSGGGWAETVLHVFKNDGSDGFYPQSNVIFDMLGNLYGTTGDGGAGTCSPYGCGTVFELSPQAGGTWAETILHSFQPGSQDGHGPYGGLAIDATGSLYGSTAAGGGVGCLGDQGCGTVFELALQSGVWTETLLHRFGGTDGEEPEGYLMFDAAGNLYGTTQGGGKCSLLGGCGTVFKLQQGSSGGWSTRVIYNFRLAGQNGVYPSLTGLAFDTAGNIYGTTGSGGSGSGCQDGCGTVYEITP